MSSIVAAALLSGCGAKQPEAASMEKPKYSASDVDIKAAKKMQMPIVIYGIDVVKQESGMTKPALYYVNTSERSVKVSNYHLQPNVGAAQWIDDYGVVSPKSAKKNNVLSHGWNDEGVTCVSIKAVNLFVNGQEMKLTHDNINRLFQDQNVNVCK